MHHPNEFQSSLKVVGYWFNEKKSRKFGVTDLEEACRQRNMNFVKMNLEDFEKSQKYDAILHKLTALCATALAGDIKAQSLLRKVEEYIAEHPDIHIIDPLCSIKKLLLRDDTYTLLRSITSQEDAIFTPYFTLLTKENMAENLDNLLDETRITFPVVCKPLLAGGGKDAHERGNGSKVAHPTLTGSLWVNFADLTESPGHNPWFMSEVKMALVFNKEQLRHYVVPVVAQSFIHHDAILYKIFITGAKWFVTIRPSLKNFEAGDFDTILFNSHQISKPGSCSPHTLLDKQTERLPKADLRLLERLMLLVKNALQSDLLGIDVVIDNKSGRYAIIDVNAFPGGYVLIGCRHEVTTKIMSTTGGHWTVKGTEWQLGVEHKNRINYGIERLVDYGKPMRLFKSQIDNFEGYESVPDVMEHVADTIRDKIDNKLVDYDPVFFPSIGMDQKYFVQDVSKPLSGLTTKDELKRLIATQSNNGSSKALS